MLGGDYADYADYCFPVPGLCPSPRFRVRRMIRKQLSGGVAPSGRRKEAQIIPSVGDYSDYYDYHGDYVY